MKTRFFFAAFMLLAVTGLQAQLNSLLTDASATFTNPADTNIVRNYNDQYAVGYIVDNDTGYFYSAPIEQFSSPSTLPFTAGNAVQLLIPGIEVNDMIIFGENTFFCGNINNAVGIYGWFKTDELWTSSGVSIHLGFILMAIDLQKIAIVRTPAGIINVVAIAEDYSSPMKSYIVEVPDAMNTSIYNFNYAPLPTLSTANRQTLRDLFVVNNQVVFMGMDTYSSNTFFIRKSSAINVLGDPALSQVYNYIPTGNVSVLQSIAPCAEVVLGSWLAVAHQNASGVSGGTNTVVSYIDLHTMNCVSAHVFQQDNRSDLREMKYLPATDALVLLYGVGNNSKFLVFHPAMTSSYPSFVLQSSNRYSSLDLLNNQSFLSAGKNFWYLQRTTSTSPLYPCITTSNIPINQSLYARTGSNQSLVGNSGFRTSNTNTFPVSPVTIRVTCNQ